MDNLPYIKSSKESIENYALHLREKTFKDVNELKEQLNYDKSSII